MRAGAGARTLAVVTVLGLGACSGQPTGHDLPEDIESMASTGDAAATTIDLAGPVVTGSPDAESITSQPDDGDATPDAGLQSWPDLVDGVRTGVARISTGDCQGQPSGTGTGFAVDDDLVVTAAHVVDGRASVLLHLDGQEVPAAVIQIDPVEDLALLRADAPLTGHTFEFVDADPRLAEEVAALGHPFGSQDLIFSRGAVSGFDTVTDELTGQRWPVTQTDAAVNPGNSGGPLLLQDGSVAGVIVNKRTWHPVGDDQVIPVDGTSFAVSGAYVSRVVDQWRVRPEMTLEVCDQVETGFTMPVTVYAEHPEAERVADVLWAYGSAVNAGDWELAWGLNSPVLQEQIGPYEHWLEQMWTSWWMEVYVIDVWDEPGVLMADVALHSEQAASHGPGGQPCSYWLLRYRLVPGGTGGWMIDGAVLTPGHAENPEGC